MQPFKRSRRNSSLASIFFRVAGIVLLCVVLIFLFRSVLRNAPGVALQTENVLDQFSSKSELLDKIALLENTIQSYQQGTNEVALIREENESLKRELGRSDVEQKGILARVLTAPNRSFYDTIIVDIGTDQGVTEGQIAFAFDSIALGTVTEVGKNRSKVQLFSAPQRETSGTAEGSDVTITLIGRGAGEYEVRMPRDVSFAVGELISHQSISFAILAKVEKIVTDPRDPFQRLLAKAPVNLNTLKFVIVK